MKTLPFFLLTLVVGCDDKSAELSKLNSEIKILSNRTEVYENQIKEVKVEASDEKARFDNEKIELVSKINNLEIILKKLSNEKKAFEQKEEVLNRLVADLEEQKMKTAQEHQDFIDTLRKEQKVQLRNLQKEIRKAEADGYKRGIDEMLYRMNKSKGL
jgi:chromosome segregation ATPase